MRRRSYLETILQMSVDPFAVTATGFPTSSAKNVT